MKVLDLNLLLYAVNRDAPRHAAARAWLEEALSGDEPVGLPWVVVLGFLRLVTSARAFSTPMAVEEALAVVDGWLDQPAVELLLPGDEHWEILRELLTHAGTAGNLVTDAHLAAMAIERGAELCSTDSDFARFARLDWRNPLAP